MKTIEEAEKEVWVKDLDVTDFFRSGVEFAQRWIPIDAELPPIGIEVIVKERFNEHEIYIFDSTRDRLIKCQDNCITHWRPIELK